MLDHLVYATPDLARSVSELAAVTGLSAAPGGRHLGQGTRNFLVALGPASYLEIIGPDPEHPADPGVTPPFGVASLTAPRLVTWAVHPPDLDGAVAAFRAAGADLGDPWPMSRRTPVGGLLSWRLASVQPPPLDGVVPFAIDWGSSEHPASDPTLPIGELLSLRLSTRDPATVHRVLGAVGLDVPVTVGEPGLTAVVRGPAGTAVLR